MEDRQSLRINIRKRRAQQEPAWCETNSRLICQHLAASHIYQHAQRIAFYLARGNEANLVPLIENAWAANKEVYLPILGLRYSGQLWFVPCTEDTPLYKNRFGIDEPMHAPHMRRTKLRNLDLILMPLVAFDQQGNRLGMGGGFYDKTLASLQTTSHHWSRPKRIGIAYAFQSVDALQGQAWDVPLDAVVTEQGLHWFTRGKE